MDTLLFTLVFFSIVFIFCLGAISMRDPEPKEDKPMEVITDEKRKFFNL